MVIPAEYLKRAEEMLLTRQIGHDGEDWGHVDCELCNEVRVTDVRRVVSESEALLNLAAVIEWMRASTTKAEGRKMSHDTKHDANDAFGLKCNCGEICWAARDTAITTVCSGEMNVSEDFPGSYTHFCDVHGHYEDLKPKDRK